MKEIEEEESEFAEGEQVEEEVKVSEILTLSDHRSKEVETPEKKSFQGFEIVEKGKTSKVSNSSFSIVSSQDAKSVAEA